MITNLEKRIWNLEIEIEGLQNDIYDHTFAGISASNEQQVKDLVIRIGELKTEIKNIDEPCQDYVDREFGILVGGTITQLFCSKHYRGEKGTDRIDRYVGFQVMTKDNVRKNVWVYSDESGRGPGVLHIEIEGIEY